MMRCTAITRSGHQCRRDAAIIVLWPGEQRPACRQHDWSTRAGYRVTATIDLTGKDRPCAVCGLYRIAHEVDPTRLHPEPVVSHDYQPSDPPAPDPDGRCRIWMGRCWTHQVADSLGHYFATHPNASTD